MSGEFELRVINRPLFYIEIVALLNRLVNDRTFRGIQLNDDQNAFLDILEGFRFKGCELFEFYLYDENIEDIHMLERLLEHYKYNLADFLYLLCSEDFLKEEIELLMKNFNSVNEIIQRNKYLSDHNWDNSRFVFERTEKFIDKLVDVFQILNVEVVKLLENQEIYQDSISKVSSHLRSKMPLDVAQSIMGKKFKRVFDFNTYYFVPSYFFMNRPMRTFNERTQIVVYPVQDVIKYDKNMLANALKIIGDNTRLEIIQKLSVRPMYGKELARELGIVTSTVSHHLDQLRSVGLIHEEREKNTKYFSINKNEYNRLCDAMKCFIVQDKN